jgi:hypothetical protein
MRASGMPLVLVDDAVIFPGIVTHPMARFIRTYVLQLGMLDGAAGFLLSVLAAVSVCFKYAALRSSAQHEGKREAGGGFRGRPR